MSTENQRLKDQVLQLYCTAEELRYFIECQRIGTVLTPYGGKMVDVRESPSFQRCIAFLESMKLSLDAPDCGFDPK